MKTHLVQDHRLFKATLKAAAKLRLEKLNGYGLSYRNFGSIGVAARIGDKLERIKCLLENKRNRYHHVKSENLYDSAVDIINYGAMLAMEINRECKNELSNRVPKPSIKNKK